MALLLLVLISTLPSSPFSPSTSTISRRNVSASKQRAEPLSSPDVHLGPAEGYQPRQIRHAYGFDQLDTNGEGKRIAVVVAYGSPTIESDVGEFSAWFNLPSPDISVNYPGGQPTKTDPRWALETALAVEWVHTLAPGATILLVVAKSDDLEDLVTALEYAADTQVDCISISWGVPEFAGQTEYDYIFDDQNIAYVASSGDFGGPPLWPASSPQVLSVGGTTLSLDDDGNRIRPEVGWQGTSRGPSSFYAQPTFQSRHLPDETQRVVPDVAFVGDPHTGVSVYSTTPFRGYTGWFVLGGTSVGAPAWAAILSLAKEAHSPLRVPADLYISSLSPCEPNEMTSKTFDPLTGLAFSSVQDVLKQLRNRRTLCPSIGGFQPAFRPAMSQKG
jgi:subtilase family serine protease